MWFAFVFLLQTGAAKGVCPDSAAHELLRQDVEAGVSLVACGSRRGLVNDLTVYRWSKTASERLFDGDAAMKAYRVERHDEGLRIQEGLAGGTFRPFVEIQVQCQGAECGAKDARCLWVPRPRSMRSTSASISKRDWTRVFLAALDGDGQARDLFLGKGLTNPDQAEHSEAFATHRADLVRLEALGCLRPR